MQKTFLNQLEMNMKNLVFLILITLFNFLIDAQTKSCLSEGKDYLSQYGVFIQSLHQGFGTGSLNSSDFMLEDGTLVDVWEINIPDETLFNIEARSLGEDESYISEYGVFIQSLHQGFGTGSLNSSDFMLEDGTLVDVWEINVPDETLFDIEASFRSDSGTALTPTLFIMQVDESQNFGELSSFTETRKGEIAIQKELNPGTYWIGVGSVDGTAGSYELNVSCPLERNCLSGGRPSFTPTLFIVKVGENQSLVEISSFTETSEGEVIIQKEMEAGRYWIGMSSGSGATGNYELNVSCQEQNGNTLESAVLVGANSTIVGEFSEGDEDWFRIEIDQIRALVIKSIGNTRYNRSLYDSYGKRIVSATLDRKIDTVLDPGTYYLNVKNFSNSSNTKYTLSVSVPFEVVPEVITRMNPEGCTNGRYLNDPKNNPGLVSDCQGLVAFANEQIRSGLSDKALLTIGLWGQGPKEKIENWRGISLSKNRVNEIFLKKLGLQSEIVPELSQLTVMRSLNLENNKMTGIIPWGFRDRALDSHLILQIKRNTIHGFGPPPQTFNTNRVRAQFDSFAHYQGPLVTEWNSEGERTQHQTPILGRWVALNVRVNHDTEQLPHVITRVFNPMGVLITETLAQATPPITELTEEGSWRSEFVFDMPGELFQEGNQIVHIIDQGDAGEIATEPVRVQGETPPKFRVVFIPVYFPGEKEDWYKHLDPKAMTKGILNLMPIADDFEARMGPSIEIKSSNDKIGRMFRAVSNLWNVEGETGEFYHGIAQKIRGGAGANPGQVAVSQLDISGTIPHEFGHNLSLGHPPGCGVKTTSASADNNYPYPNGLLGLKPIWNRFWRMFVWDGVLKNNIYNVQFTDVMSYCATENYRLLSDYNYKKASEHWLNFKDTNPTLMFTNTQTHFIRAQEPSLALSGHIHHNGVWSLDQVEASHRNPRLPDPMGTYELILLDETGVQLYTEPLQTIHLSHDQGSIWAARIPFPSSSAKEIIIINSQGQKVLHKNLPEFE